MYVLRSAVCEKSTINFNHKSCLKLHAYTSLYIAQQAIQQKLQLLFMC